MASQSAAFLLHSFRCDHPTEQYGVVLHSSGARFVSSRNLLTYRFLGVDVETAANISFKRSIRRVARHASLINPTVFACMMPQSVLHLEGPPSIEVGDVSLQTSVEVIGVHVLCPAITGFLFQSAPDEIQPTFIEVMAKLINSGHPNQPEPRRTGIRFRTQLIYGVGAKHEDETGRTQRGNRSATRRGSSRPRHTFGKSGGASFAGSSGFSLCASRESDFGRVSCHAQYSVSRFRGIAESADRELHAREFL
jgi:hypothetical protein